jgi:hypothetical protein
MPAETATVNRPPHPLGQMTTSELAGYRRELENAIAFFDRKTPVPAARERLQAKLDDVLAEQDDRRRIANANRPAGVAV